MATSIEKQEGPGKLFPRFWKNLWTVFLLAMSMILHPSLLYFEFFKSPKKFQEMPNRTGEVVVLTGGTRGIGKQVLTKLLQAGFHVILGCRSPKAGKDIIASIRKSKVSTGSCNVYELDLKSLKSVRIFTENVLMESPRIDLLINNAGMMVAPYEITEDGYVSQFQVNYLSHFLLTNLLLQRMKETSTRSDKKIAVRIVNTSSASCFAVDLDFADLEKCKVYSSPKSYADSKLCQVMHANYLDKILQDEGVRVRAYSVHPGVIPSDLWDDIPFQKFVTAVRKWKWFKTIEDGADTVIYTALSPELEGVGGAYINCCEIYQRNTSALDVGVQKKLWDRSLQLSSSFSE